MTYIKPAIHVLNIAPQQMLCMSIGISNEEVDASESFAIQKEFNTPFDDEEQD